MNNSISEESFKLFLEKSLELCGITELKAEQETCVRRLIVNRDDILAVLPTGYGESLIYRYCRQIYSSKAAQR